MGAESPVKGEPKVKKDTKLPDKKSKVSENAEKQPEIVKNYEARAHESHKRWVESQVLGLLNTIPGPYKFTYEDKGDLS